MFSSPDFGQAEVENLNFGFPQRRKPRQKVFSTVEASMARHGGEPASIVPPA